MTTTARFILISHVYYVKLSSNIYSWWELSMTTRTSRRLRETTLSWCLLFLSVMRQEEANASSWLAPFLLLLTVFQFFFYTIRSIVILPIILQAWITKWLKFQSICYLTRTPSPIQVNQRAINLYILLTGITISEQYTIKLYSAATAQLHLYSYTCLCLCFNICFLFRSQQLRLFNGSASVNIGFFGGSAINSSHGMWRV